jgi:hypothetical protein
MTIALAWTSVYLIPGLFGVSLSTICLYQPDFVVLLVATATTGVLWAVCRLGVFYGGRLSRHRTWRFNATVAAGSARKDVVE